MSCKTCHVGPGKFEGEGPLTALASWYVNNGSADHVIGRYDIFKSPLCFDDEADAIEFVYAEGYCEACIKVALEHARALVGLAYWTDDNGFAYTEEFSTELEYQEACERAETEELGEE